MINLSFVENVVSCGFSTWELADTTTSPRKGSIGTGAYVVSHHVEAEGGTVPSTVDHDILEMCAFPELEWYVPSRVASELVRKWIVNKMYLKSLSCRCTCNTREGREAVYGGCVAAESFEWDRMAYFVVCLRLSFYVVMAENLLVHQPRRG